MQIAIRRMGLWGGAILGLAACASPTPQPDPKDMTFFVSNVSPGKGGDLGGLAGADRHCQSLAKAAGAGDRVWRAYLSTQGPKWNEPGEVSARDRIGSGPWQNAKGLVIARNVEELHSPANNLNKATALNEKGQVVNGRTETPNTHDILTGSRPDGTAFPGAPNPDMTCGNWTRSWRQNYSYGSLGLGHFLMVGRELNDMSQVVAVMVVIVALGTLTDRLIFFNVEHRIRERWGVLGS